MTKLSLRNRNNSSNQESYINAIYNAPDIEKQSTFYKKLCIVLVCVQVILTYILITQNNSCDCTHDPHGDGHNALQNNLNNDVTFKPLLKKMTAQGSEQNALHSLTIYDALDQEQAVPTKDIASNLRKFWNYIVKTNDRDDVEQVIMTAKPKFLETTKQESSQNRNWTLVDIGYNLGGFSYSFIKLLHKHKFFDKQNGNGNAEYLNRLKIYGFEPVPQYASASPQLLREVLYDDVNNDHNHMLSKAAANNQINITIVNSAAGKTPEHVIENTIWCDTNNLGWNTLVAEEANPNMKQVDIKITDFDWFFQTVMKEEKTIDFLKIDVEGFEYQVLDSMHSTLMFLKKQRKLPILIIEVAWGVDHPQREKEIEQFNFLFDQVGYIKQPAIFTQTGTADFLIFPQKEYSTRIY